MVVTLGFLSGASEIFSFFSALTVFFVGCGLMADTGAMAEEDSFIVTFDEDSLQAMRQADAQDVVNLIDNMQNGDVTGADASDYIFEKKFWAKKVVDCTPEEMEVNNRYIVFLDSASDVVDSHMYETGNVDEMIEVMEAKRKLI